METPDSVLEITSRSAEDTYEAGRRTGEALTQGLVLALRGDLGSGKTTFVQGLARGLGVPASYYVTSPTYTIVNEYPGRIRLFHIDLYRLGSPEELEDIGLLELLQPDAVVAIEWPEITVGALPKDHLAVTFRIRKADTRRICLHAYGLQAGSVIGRLDLSRQASIRTGAQRWH